MSRRSRFFEPPQPFKMPKADLDEWVVRHSAIEVLIEAHFPEAERARVREAMYWAIGGKEGVLVHVGKDAVSICLPTIMWISTHRPTPAARLWRSIPHGDLTEDALTNAITEGCQVRRAEFVTCRFCGQSTPPERLHNQGDVCQACAVKHLRVIY